MIIPNVNRHFEISLTPKRMQLLQERNHKVVLGLSRSHCFSRLGCCGQHCDGEKMSFRDGSWLELDIGILSLEN